MKRETHSLEDVLLTVLDHRGRTPKKLGGDFSPIGIPVLSAKNVKDGRIVDDGELRYIDIDMWHRWMPEPLRSEDVLLTSEAPLGECALISEATEYCLGQRLFALRPNRKKVLGPYLFYWLQSPEGQAQLARRESGTTAQGIRQAELLEVDITLPGPEEQQRAIAPLRLIDRAVDVNRALARTIEAIFAGLFRLWFCSDEDDDIEGVRTQLPERLLPTEADKSGRRSGSLGEIGNHVRRPIRSGLTPSDSPYIGLEHLPRRRLVVESWGDAGEVVSTTSAFERDDILFGKLRPYFHKVALAPTNGACSTDILVLQPKSEEWRGFFLGHVSSPELIDFVDAASGGTRMPRTNWETIARFEIQLPSLDSAARFYELTRPLIERIQGIGDHIRTLKGLHRRLLRPLIRSEIDPNDLNPSAPWTS